MPADWKNVDFDSHEIDSALIDEFTFEDLFLMINCNISDINAATVTKEWNEFLEAKIEEAKDIFNCNLENIVKHAIKERKEKRG